MSRPVRAFLLVVIMGFCLAPFAFMQVSAEPHDEIYAWFDIWEGRGYLQQMPVFRPYPQNVIVEALERVSRVGDSESQAIADDYLEDLAKPVNTEWQLISEMRTRDGDDFHAKGAVAVDVTGRLGPNLTAAGSIAGVLLDMEDGELLPKGERTEWDIADDFSEISVAGRSLAALNQVNTSVAWGTEALYLHAGVMRRSFGPFFDDGVVWSSYARQSPGLVASWHVNNFRLTAGLFSLTATQLYQERTPFTADEANVNVINDTDIPGAEFYYDPDEYPGKWVFLQDYRWQALPWLSLAFFESVTWGPRLELGYLMPLKWTFNVQNGIGDVDSSKIGISMVARPREDLQIPFLVYVDDASFNDLAQFDFDTKLKLGVQTGAIWTPEHPLLRRIKADYLALFPYMYTHDENTGVYEALPNYTNYTHQGSSIGPGLEPNSDRLELEVTVTPVPRLAATLRGTFSRHANASEGIDGLVLPNNDGTITDDGRYYHFVLGDDPGAGSDEVREIYIERGSISYQDELRFLDQENVETVLQAGFDVAYTVPFRTRGSLSFQAGYVFEYIRDPIGWAASGATQAGLKDDETDPDSPEVIVYEVVTGADQMNHYASLKVILSY